jgi:D-sedoheptulose 7-phosphate isomerase
MRSWTKSLSTAIANVESELDAFEHVAGYCRKIRSGGTVYFIGNGGSASIASHMAIDWLNAGGFSALAFNDPASLTCLANDHHYRNVFKIPLQKFVKPNDIVFAISSSGESASITWAVYAVRHICTVVTLSGFEPSNELRQIGHYNFYVPSKKYGIVETAHLAILHSLLDGLCASGS